MRRSSEQLYVLFTVTRKNQVLVNQGTDFLLNGRELGIGVVTNAI